MPRKSLSFARARSSFVGGERQRESATPHPTAAAAAAVVPGYLVPSSRPQFSSRRSLWRRRCRQSRALSLPRSMFTGEGERVAGLKLNCHLFTIAAVSGTHRPTAGHSRQQDTGAQELELACTEPIVLNSTNLKHSPSLFPFVLRMYGMVWYDIVRTSRLNSFL